MRPSFFVRCALFIAALLAAAAPALAQWNSSAVAPSRPKAQAVETLRLDAATAPVARVELPAIDSSLIDSVKRANASRATKRLQVGIGRDIEAVPEASSAALQWVPVTGGLAAQWQVSSPAARALRVGLVVSRMPQSAQIRFAGSGATAVYGPFGARDALGHEYPVYWSPVLEGDTATVELFVPRGVETTEMGLRIAQVSHLFVSPADPRAESLAKASSGACEVDLICRSASDSALALTGRAVARMTFSDGLGGSTFLCTGTLLNPVNGSFTPYFYSANHCISTQASASTLTTHWFYDAVACGVPVVSSSYVQLPGGATLLYANASSDGMLLRLNQTPPQNAVYAGWDAASLAAGTAIIAVHHPQGDLKKVSLGTSGGFGTTALASGSFIVANWNSIATGVTEGGSSGSGIFTPVGSPASDYRFRGGLLGGPSSCDATPADLHDYYSRLDAIYPSISQYIGASTAATNYTALWWNPNESGWGINVTHQGDILFATLFTYDSAGNPMWLVMSSGDRFGLSEIFTGNLYRTTGPAFNSNPFTPIGPGNITQVGTMSLSFSGPAAGVLTYNVNGVPVTKNIIKQVYGSRAAVCQGGTGDRASLTNYQDLWWNPNESGWGLNVTQQDNTIFATLFTYDFSGKGMWLVMSAGTRQADGSYAGDLYVVTGASAFNAQPFVPITTANIRRVGSMQLRFSNGTSGTVVYTVDGVQVFKSITRQVYSSPLPACAS